MAKKKIPEVRYRASRVCRTLGNPTAYEMLHMLRSGPRTPRQLAAALGVSVAVVSDVLRSLRQLDLVRYEVKWRERFYWTKYDTVHTLTAALEALIEIILADKS